MSLSPQHRRGALQSNFLFETTLDGITEILSCFLLHCQSLHTWRLTRTTRYPYNCWLRLKIVRTTLWWFGQNIKAGWESFDIIFDVVIWFARKRSYTARQRSRVKRRTVFNGYLFLRRPSNPPTELPAGKSVLRYISQDNCGYVSVQQSDSAQLRLMELST